MDRRHHRVARGVILALACALAAPVAQAQDEGADGSTILFREGVEHLREGRFPQAVEAFRGSYRLSPRVTTMCNLALTYDRWGTEHREAAIRAYRTCAAEDESGRYRPHALERITAIERELALEGGVESETADRDPEDPDSSAASPDAPTEPPSAGAGPSDGPESAGLPEDGAPTPATPAPRDRAFLWASVGAGGAAAVALVVGVALALDAQGRVAALDADVPDGRIVRGSAEADRLETARAIADGATAAYVIAAVLGVAAAGLLTVDLVLGAGDDAERARVRLGPTGVSGRF